jgi:drug/metabolite transporter (DMT)-like permease
MRLTKWIKYGWGGVALAGVTSVLLNQRKADAPIRGLTYLAWLSFPSSFVTAPIANRALMTLDIESAWAIDFVVAVAMAAVGYWQWFWVIPKILHRFRKQ